MTLHPEKYYIGVEDEGDAARSAGEPFTVEGMVVDWNGKLAPTATEAARRSSCSTSRPTTATATTTRAASRATTASCARCPRASCTAKVEDGKFTFDVTPGEADGGYVVRVKAGKAKTELVLDGDYSYDYYGYGDGGRVDQTPRPAKPTQLKLDAAEGDRGRRADHREGRRRRTSGKVLWTVETDHVVTAEWKDVTARRGDVELHARRVRAQRLRQRVPRQGSAPRVARTRSCPTARSASRAARVQADRVHAGRSRSTCRRRSARRAR